MGISVNANIEGNEQADLRTNEAGKINPIFISITLTVYLPGLFIHQQKCCLLHHFETTGETNIFILLLRYVYSLLVYL